MEVRAAGSISSPKAAIHFSLRDTAAHLPTGQRHGLGRRFVLAAAPGLSISLPPLSQGLSCPGKLIFSSLFRTRPLSLVSPPRMTISWAVPESHPQGPNLPPWAGCSSAPCPLCADGLRLFANHALHKHVLDACSVPGPAPDAGDPIMPQTTKIPGRLEFTLCGGLQLKTVMCVREKQNTTTKGTGILDRGM